MHMYYINLPAVQNIKPQMVTVTPSKSLTFSIIHLFRICLHVDQLLSFLKVTTLSLSLSTELSTSSSTMTHLTSVCPSR